MTEEEFEAIKPGDDILIEYTDDEVYNFVETYYMKIRSNILKTATGWNMWSDYIVTQSEGPDRVDYGIEYNKLENIKIKHLPAIHKGGGNIFKRHLVQDIFEKKHVFYKGDRLT